MKPTCEARYYGKNDYRPTPCGRPTKGARHDDAGKLRAVCGIHSRSKYRPFFLDAS